eukprot:1131127-Pyramimonas_sp.AAC.1
MSANQKQISRQKRQWAEAVAGGREFKPKGKWLFDPEKEEEALHKANKQKKGEEKHQHYEGGHHQKEGEKEKTKEATEKKDEQTGKQQGGKEETQQSAKAHHSWAKQGWRPLCRDFKKGWCSYGARCRFYHSGADASAGSSTDNGNGSRP